MTFSLENAPLGKTVAYEDHYNPKLLFAIPRSVQRELLARNAGITFSGKDIWVASEISWLNNRNKPMTAVGYIAISADSPALIESKSMKLYLNSFNQSCFDDIATVENTITKDLSESTQSDVTVQLFSFDAFSEKVETTLSGIALDSLDIDVDTYNDIQPDVLTLKSEKIVEEQLYSHLLKSNCLVTGQPDWASITIHYHGPKIDHASLLKYLISYRNHRGFHEQCVEQIFVDILERCKPKLLTVHAHYSRRGGIYIAPWRTNDVNAQPKLIKLLRQ